MLKGASPVLNGERGSNAPYLRYKGLSKLVLEQTGHEPKADEAYVFFPKNRDMIKILSRDAIGTSIVELYGMKAKEMKAELAEMGMV